MRNDDKLAEKFEAHREHLQAVAYRMLGSLSEAEDAVQESWLRLSRSQPDGIENLGGWLTTVVSRICLDMLRWRKSRREDAIDELLPNNAADDESRCDPEQEALLADSIGIALLVVLDRLSPAERVAFVLHDIFAMPYTDIASIVGKSSAAARQLASRARRRVQGGSGPVSSADLGRKRELVDAFLAAARAGDFDGLIAALDPDVELRDDRHAGAPRVTRGARELAGQVAGRAKAAQSALVNGSVGVIAAPRGRLLYVLELSIREGRIARIELISDRSRLQQLDLAVLDHGARPGGSAGETEEQRADG